MASYFDWPHALTQAQRDECEQFTRILLREYDSYGELGAIMEADLEPPIFYAVLGQEWSMFDNIAEYAEELEVRLSKASRSDLNLMMSKVELARWKKLPAVVRAYRFAYDNNLYGFSYSLCRKVAESFNGKLRYTQADNPNRFLVTADIPKRWTVFKSDREEDEIIVVKPSVAKTVTKRRLK